jgi:glycosyltransferase involved in cell wall biosynthesis
MRVLFDHQIMGAQTRGGVSRYFCELISALRRDRLAEVRLPRIYADNEHFRPVLPGSPVLQPVIQTIRRAKPSRKVVESVWRRARSRLNRRASLQALRRQDFDVFHPTYYDPYFLGSLQGKPFVLTIYDMIHEIYPEYFSPGDRTREHKAILAGAAARIIAISAATKSDIVRYLGVDPGKIEVIHLANSLTGESEELAVPGRYVLYVGGRGRRYKNFGDFFLAFAKLAAALPDLHLVCVDPKDFGPAELELIRGAGLEGRCVSIPANDRQLAFLYEHASLFVYPSLCEGFGLPVLEAFASGCPVALSHTSCFPEIAGEAALYFDPSDVSSIGKALETALYDPASRQALIQRGQERLKRFSWATTAARTAAVYESVVAGSKP